MAERHLEGLQARPPSYGTVPWAHETTAADDGRVPGGSGRRSAAGERKQWSAASALLVVVLLHHIGDHVYSVLLPDLGPAYFNGGVNPCTGAHHTTTECDVALRRFSSIWGIFSGAASTLALLSGPIVGAAADKVGTKPVFVLCLIMETLVALAFLGLALHKLPIYYYFTATELIGLAPLGIVASMVVMESSTPADRATSFAKISAISAIPASFGPALLWVASTTSLPWIALCSAAISLLVAALTPSSKGAETEPDGTASGGRLLGKSSGDLSSTLNALRDFFSRAAVRRVLLAAFGMSFIEKGLLAIFPLYVKAAFGISAEQLSMIIAACSFSAVLSQRFLVPVLEQRMGLKYLILAGLACCLLVNLAYAAIGIFSSSVLYPLAVLQGLASICSPGMSALVTNAAAFSESEAGTLLGAANSVITVGGVAGPLVFRILFAHLVNPYAVAVLLQILLAAWILGIPSIMFHLDRTRDDGSGEEKGEV